MLIDASINSASTMSDSSARSESSRANPRDEVELVDTHAHLNFDAYKDDADEVIRRSLDEGVWMINVGSHYEASKRAVELAEKHEKGIFAAVGLHPINLDTGLIKRRVDKLEGNHFERPSTRAKLSAGPVPYRNEVSGAGEFDSEEYKALAKSGKVVAIGEIGLDYYWKPKTTAKKEIFKQKQKDLLLKELGLAQELDLPVIFHCRMAHQDLIEILKERQVTSDKKIRGVIHCFTGNQQEAEEYMKMGFYLGFNGIIFKFDLKEVIKKIPLERILVETDCPYLSPLEFKKERNEPIAVKYVAKEIANIKNLSYEEIIEATTQNAKKLFKI